MKMEMPSGCEPISLQEQYTIWIFMFASSINLSKGPKTISQIVLALRVSGVRPSFKERSDYKTGSAL